MFSVYAELEKRLKQRAGRQDLVERNILPRTFLIISYYTCVIYSDPELEREHLPSGVAKVVSCCEVEAVPSGISLGQICRKGQGKW